MKTSNLNNKERLSTEDLKALQSFDNPLQTFHHILYDSLMPWLPENNDLIRYRIILPDLMKTHNPFFKNLLNICNKRNILLTPDLKKEWKVFTRITLNPRAVKIHNSGIVIKVSSIKIVFYRELILQSLLISESLYLSLMEYPTDTIKRFITNQWLETIQDLRNRIYHCNQVERVPDNITILFFAEIALRVLEREIQWLFPSYCEPVSFYSSKNGTEPGQAAMEQNYPAITTLTHWFKEIYIPEFVTKKKPAEVHSLSLKPTEADILMETLHKPSAQAPSPVAGTANPQVEMVPEKETKQIIGTREVRELLGIGKTKLLQLCKDNEIPNFRIGRLYKFEKAKILRYREQQKANVSS